MITENMLKLIGLQTSMLGDLSLQTIQMLIRLWKPFRGWYNEDLVNGHAARSVALVETAQRNARMRQRSYMKFVFDELDIKPLREPDIVKTITLQEGGVDIYPRNANGLEVWKRPAEQYRYAISQGQSEGNALLKALDRVEKMAHTDIQLARRNESRAIFKTSPTVTGYRRIIHPELSEDGTSCGLCVVASQRIYASDDLLPIHDDCNCDVLPITLLDDPGKELNESDLERIYQGAGSTYAGDLLKTKVAFTEHGELGPIIENKRPKGYQGSKAGRRLSKPDDRSPLEQLEYQKKILTESSARLLSRKRQGDTTVDNAIVWQRDRLAVLNRQIAALRR